MQQEHRRPRCLGCQRPCAEDEGYRTSAGWVPVCEACLARHRSGWMRSEKASRIRAVEAVEGLAS